MRIKIAVLITLVAGLAPSAQAQEACSSYMLGLLNNQPRSIFDSSRCQRDNPALSRDIDAADRLRRNQQEWDERERRMEQYLRMDAEDRADRLRSPYGR